MDTSTAYETLKSAFSDDEDYAWAWHCNIAMCAYDEGVAHGKANVIAARVMRTLFHVDTTDPPSTTGVSEDATAPRPPTTRDDAPPGADFHLAKGSRCDWAAHRGRRGVATVDSGKRRTA